MLRFRGFRIPGDSGCFDRGREAWIVLIMEPDLRSLDHRVSDKRRVGVKGAAQAFLTGPSAFKSHFVIACTICNGGAVLKL